MKEWKKKEIIIIIFIIIIIILVILFTIISNNNNIIIRQQNSKCTLYEDRDEKFNYISVSSKLTKWVLDWVGTVIHWKLRKRFKFDHTTKWYMHKPESIQENETHEILRNFEIQMDHLISTKMRDLMLINKKGQLAVLWILTSRQSADFKIKESEGRL